MDKQKDNHDVELSENTERKKERKKKERREIKGEEREKKCKKGEHNVRYFMRSTIKVRSKKTNGKKEVKKEI